MRALINDRYSVEVVEDSWEYDATDAESSIKIEAVYESRCYQDLMDNIHGEDKLTLNVDGVEGEFSVVHVCFENPLKPVFTLKSYQGLRLTQDPDFMLLAERVLSVQSIAMTLKNILRVYSEMGRVPPKRVCKFLADKIREALP